MKISGISVDFGGTKIASCRVVENSIVQRLEVATDGTASADEQLSTIVNLVEQMEPRREDAIGVAVAGRVDSSGTWHAVNTTTLTQIQSVPLKDILSAKFHRPVNIQNDAIAAAMGEHICGAGQAIDRFGFITVSTGVGGGIVLNGRPVISPDGIAGHIGFSTSRRSSDRCGSGRVGTVEAFAAGRAIATRAEQLGYVGYDARMVFEAHLRGDGWATDLITSSASAIAELCANLKAILGLDRIAIGGSIGLAAGYREQIEGTLATEPVPFRPQIVSATLGKDGALIGVLSDVYQVGALRAH